MTLVVKKSKLVLRQALSFKAKTMGSPKIKTLQYKFLRCN